MAVPPTNEIIVQKNTTSPVIKENFFQNLILFEMSSVLKFASFDKFCVIFVWEADAIPPLVDRDARRAVDLDR